jgi:predicted lipoprotein
MDTSRFARHVSRLLVTSSLAMIVMTAAGCQQSASDENGKGITIETDGASGAVDIDVNADGKKIKVDAGKDGADARVD